MTVIDAIKIGDFKMWLVERRVPGTNRWMPLREFQTEIKAEGYCMAVEEFTQYSARLRPVGKTKKRIDAAEALASVRSAL